jgi:hypothetical protein
VGGPAGDSLALALGLTDDETGDGDSVGTAEPDEDAVGPDVVLTTAGPAGELLLQAASARATRTVAMRRARTLTRPTG